MNSFLIRAYWNRSHDRHLEVDADAHPRHAGLKYRQMALHTVLAQIHIEFIAQLFCTADKAHSGFPISFQENIAYQWIRRVKDAR